MDDPIQLEKGLTFYYSHESEFARREIPIEKQVAMAYEAGLQAGRYERAQAGPCVFNPSRGVWARTFHAARLDAGLKPCASRK